MLHIMNIPQTMEGAPVRPDHQVRRSQTIVQNIAGFLTFPQMAANVIQ